MQGWRGSRLEITILVYEDVAWFLWYEDESEREDRTDSACLQDRDGRRQPSAHI
jgi:hypothetical protein